MQQVLEYMRDRQQTFARSSFMGFLQDSRLLPQERLSFLPCVAPFVLGFADLSRALMGRGAEAAPELPQESTHWALYLNDLEVLGLSRTSDLSGMLQLLWGSAGSFTRRTLYDLVDLATNASPARRQILALALQAAGRMSLGALEHVARSFHDGKGKELASIRSLLAQFDQSSWPSDPAELDLPPELEQDELGVVDEAFSLLGDLADHLLTYSLSQIEAKRAQLTWEPPSSLTFQEFGTARLQSLCEAVGYGAGETETAKRFFTFMCSPWGARQIGTTPPWKSDITDDHTPFELSLAIEDGRPEVRFLMEAQSAYGPSTLRSTWEDGLALTRRLNTEFGVPLERFNLVKDLFEPVDARARFALWHAFFLKDGRPDLKVYLNPAARGPENANTVVRQALERLGFSGAWRCISEALRPNGMDQILYFSLDLSTHRAARVKVYVAHRHITAEELESVMSRAKEHVPGEAWIFCQALKGHTGRFEASRPVLTCLSFTSDDDKRPSSVTLHVPVRCYVRNDGQSMERIRFLLEPQGHEILKRSVGALARRQLEAGVGLIQWASMRRQGGKIRTTIYLATEAYGSTSHKEVAPQPSVFLSEPATRELSRAVV
jgi:DMATS type aromatic prenyltransferase